MQSKQCIYSSTIFKDIFKGLKTNLRISILYYFNLKYYVFQPTTFVWQFYFPVTLQMQIQLIHYDVLLWIKPPGNA